jgi:hypothetical protein
MKKLFSKLFMVGALGGLTLLASCGGDDDEPTPAGPSIVVTTTPAAVDGVISMTTDDELIISVNASTPGGFNTATLSGAVTVTETRTTLGIDAGATSADFSFDPIVFNNAGTATITVTVIDDIIVDGASQTTSETLTIEVTEAAIPINSYTAVLLGAQGNAEKGFYNASEGIRYSYAEARDASTVTESPVDFAYYWGNTNKSTIAAIDNGGLNDVYTSVGLAIDGVFGTKNATRFLGLDLTAAEFDAIEDEEALLDAASFEVSGTGSVTGLAVGDVFAFKLDADRGGLFGLVKISTINDTNGTGTITIEVKVEQGS